MSSGTPPTFRSISLRTATRPGGGHNRSPISYRSCGRAFAGSRRARWRLDRKLPWHSNTPKEELSQAPGRFGQSAVHLSVVVVRWIRGRHGYLGSSRRQNCSHSCTTFRTRLPIVPNASRNNRSTGLYSSHGGGAISALIKGVPGRCSNTDAVIGSRNGVVCAGCTGLSSCRPKLCAQNGPSRQ